MVAVPLYETYKLNLFDGRFPPWTKNVCFVGCVSNIKPNNFFVDECGCQEVKLRTSLTKDLPKQIL